MASEIAVLTILAELKEALLTLESGQIDAAPACRRSIVYAVKLWPRPMKPSTAFRRPRRNGRAWAPTLVTGLFTNDRLLVGHIGDSRLYRLRDNDFSQLTEDHSLLQEQIKYGFITLEQAKFSHDKNLVSARWA